VGLAWHKQNTYSEDAGGDSKLCLYGNSHHIRFSFFFLSNLADSFPGTSNSQYLLIST